MYKNEPGLPVILLIDAAIWPIVVLLSVLVIVLLLTKSMPGNSPVMILPCDQRKSFINTSLYIIVRVEDRSSICMLFLSRI